MWARSILNLPGVEGKVSSSSGGILVFPFLIEKWILIIGGVGVICVNGKSGGRVQMQRTQTKERLILLHLLNEAMGRVVIYSGHPRTSDKLVYA